MSSVSSSTKCALLVCRSCSGAASDLLLCVLDSNNLEKKNLKGTSGKEREGVAGQDTDEPSEQTANLPSAYCEIVINDDMVYKTRVKQYTTMPFFEAGTEKFIRNFEDAVVRVVGESVRLSRRCLLTDSYDRNRIAVRDSALREKDPILGIVNLPLKQLFSESSEVTRMFAVRLETFIFVSVVRH